MLTFTVFKPLLCSSPSLSQVWDLEEGSMIYQSSILSASPLTALAIDPSFLRLAAGSGDGVVRFFDLSSLPACRCLQVINAP